MASMNASGDTNPGIAQAVGDGDLRVLLMCLVHLTGDARWLEPPYLTVKDVSIVPDPAAGLSDEVADEIRAAVVRHAFDRPVIESPDDDLMLRMMTACTADRIDPRYVGMMREEMGFESKDVTWPEGRQLPSDLDVVIIGAGPSGIALAVRLQRLGIPYRIFESGPSVGGVWRDNRYPGCAVDTPNHFYSFSFAPPHRWPRYFSAQPDLETYLQRTADDFGVTSRTTFGANVEGAVWNESTRCWTVAVRTDGVIQHVDTAVLVSAIGQLHAPKTPIVDGLDSFAGSVFHSSRWPADLDLDGRSVAVIGTGATAMQIVPEIADQVASLAVYQRSAQWARPIERYHDPIPAGSQWLIENLPYYAPWYRFTMTWRYSDGLLRHLQKDPDWPHPERAINRRNDLHRQEMTDHIVRELDGRADLIAKCVPDYPPYGKRILLDNGWFRTLCEPHVELVTDAIARIEADGIVTGDDTRRRCDVIVFATGFEVTQMAARLDVVGRNGRRLADEWADDDPRAYLGIAVPGFPNFFCLQGPNTGLGHGGSAIFQSECQARHITSCLMAMVEVGAGTIEVTREAHDADVAAVDAAHERMIWTHPGMDTYYRNPHGRVVTVMPWSLLDYWSRTHDVDRRAYDFT
jgi:4-hydroxyacetophenone monooxygenase